MRAYITHFGIILGIFAPLAMASVVLASHGQGPFTSLPVHPYTFSDKEFIIVKCEHEGGRAIFTADEQVLFSQNREMCIDNKSVLVTCNVSNVYDKRPVETIYNYRKGSRQFENLFDLSELTSTNRRPLIWFDTRDCIIGTCVVADSRTKCEATPRPPEPKKEEETCKVPTLKNVRGDVYVQKNQVGLDALREEVERAESEYKNQVRLIGNARGGTAQKQDELLRLYDWESYKVAGLLEAIDKAKEFYQERLAALPEFQRKLDEKRARLAEAYQNLPEIKGQEGMKLSVGDSVFTDFDSSAVICLPDHEITLEGISFIILTIFDIGEFTEEDVRRARIDHLLGIIRARFIEVKAGDFNTDFEVKTGNVTTGVRGTAFSILVTNSTRDGLISKGTATKEEILALFVNAMKNLKDLKVIVTLTEGELELKSLGNTVTLKSTGPKDAKNASVQYSNYGVPFVIVEGEKPPREFADLAEIPEIKEKAIKPSKNVFWSIVIAIILVLIATLVYRTYLNRKVSP